MLRAHYRDAGPVRIASPLRADMIFGRDSFLYAQPCLLLPINMDGLLVHRNLNAVVLVVAPALFIFRHGILLLQERRVIAILQLHIAL